MHLVPVALLTHFVQSHFCLRAAGNIPCQFVGIVPELLRGIRLHFGKFVKSIDDSAIERSQLGLGHSYSRCKVKFNVHRSDNMIIQAISILDQLDKDINTFSMRVKEWYGYHFPELVKVVPDNYDYARAVRFIKRRGSLTAETQSTPRGRTPGA